MDSELLAFFGDGEDSQHNASLRFLQRHPSLLRDLDQVRDKLRGVGDPGGDGVGPGLPKQVADHEVLEVLGAGGMGVVVRARPTGGSQGGDDLALKLADRGDPVACDALEREAEVLLRLRHDHVVRALATGQTDTHRWLAMELVSGTVLSRRLDVRPSVDEAMRWFAELADGVAALHRHGLVHRDIKPGNVMIRSDGSACLIDLGLVEAEGGCELGFEQRMLAGTVPYMSPEQTLSGLLALDGASDVYSLAATVYEALTGHRTVHGATRGELLEQVAFVAVPPPSRYRPELGEAVDAIFAKALHKQRPGRYASADELLEDLARWRQGRALVHAKLPLGQRASRRLRRHRRALVLAAVLAMVLTAVWWWQRAEHDGRRAAWSHALAAELEGREPQQVRQRLEQGLREFGDDDAFVATLQRCAADVADVLVQATIAELGFVVDGATSLASFAARAALSVRLARHAERDGFAFVRLVHLWLQRGPDAALQQLPVGDAAASALLGELRAVLLLEALDLDGYRRQVERLDAVTTADLRVAWLPLRAYRNVRGASLARTLARPAEREAALESARGVVAVARSMGVPGRLLLVCEVLLDLESGAFARAARALEAVEAPSANTVLPANTVPSANTVLSGTVLYRVLARALANGVDEGAIRELRELAAGSADREASLRGWLARSSHAYGHLPVACAFVLGWPEQAAVDAEAVRLTYALAGAAFVAERWTTCLPLCEQLVGWAPQVPAAAARRRDAEALAVWSALHVLRAAVDAKAADAVAMAALARRTVARLAADDAPDPSVETQVAAALARLYEARFRSVPDRAAALQRARDEAGRTSARLAQVVAEREVTGAQPGARAALELLDEALRTVR
jgi:hypothetical protein